MKFFLTAKAWQLFLLFTSPMVAAPVLVSLKPSITPGFIAILMGATLVFALVWLGWMWAIARAANERLGPELRKSQTLMTAGIAFAILYTASIPWLWPDMTTNQGGASPGLVIPMHLLSMVGIFYALLYTANRLATLERNQRLSFVDYSGAFFLLWFYPVGVWFIQPRVNRMLGANP